jgi:hypothetical protein
MNKNLLKCGLWVPLSILILALTGGCASAGGHWWAPRTWFSSRPASIVTAATGAVNTSKDQAVSSARSEVTKASIALLSAPASRPVAIASPAVANAQALLDQVAGPMTASDLTELRKLVSDLLSDDTAVRQAAEGKQADADSKIAEISSKLSEREAALSEAQAKLKDAFTRENLLADTYRSEVARRWWIIGGGTLIAIVLGAGWIWLKITAGGIPGAIGGLLKDLDEVKSPEADNLRKLLDPVLNRLEQAAIRAHT